MLCNQTLDVLPPESIVPLLVSLPKKKKNLQKTVHQKMQLKDQIVCPQRAEGLMGYGIWGDPRAASSVWPCIAPNGSTNYQFPQAPIAKTKVVLYYPLLSKNNNHFHYILEFLLDYQQSKNYIQGIFLESDKYLLDKSE